MAHPTDTNKPMTGFPLLLAAALCALLVACGGQQPEEQRYALRGTVISIDRAEQRIVVDHEEIQGFMAAMAMPYPVADPQLLDVAAPGDEITADVVVADRSAHLENIVVVKKAETPTPAPGGSLQEKLPGGMPLNFELANQEGRRLWKSAEAPADLTQFAGSSS